MSEAELRNLHERWLITKSAIDDAWNVIIEAFRPVFEAIKQIALYFAEMVQRAYLCQLLPRWIPEVVRAWLARHWPKALLPELAEAIEWMKAETAQ